MTEQDPNLSSRMVDLAWEAALASNRAFDKMQAADAAIAQLNELSPDVLGVQVIRDGASEELQSKYHVAESTFDLFSRMAAVVMRMEDTPFAQKTEAADASEKDRFHQQVEDFLNPEIPMSLSEQLKIANELWGCLGYRVPHLSQDQWSQLRAKAEASPTRRVVPAPLLDLEQRKLLGEDARKFTGDQINTNYEAVWTPDEGGIYGKLLRDPEATVKAGRNSYGLRYKAYDTAGNTDRFLNRTELTSHLVNTGRGIAADSGTVWVFPVMDVRVEAPRSDKNAGELFGVVDPTVMPESLLAMQILHLTNGTPNPNYSFDVANEVVFELDKNGVAVSPVGVAGVSWDPYYRQLVRVRWNAGARRDRLGVRVAESGL